MESKGVDALSPKRTKRPLFRWVVAAIALIFYLPGLPSCVMSHTGKIGKVVEGSSGRGVPDAAVIATAYLTCSGSFGVESRTSTETEYRVVAHTDSEGRYVVPSTWFDLDFAHFVPFLGACHEVWTLKPFKLGYVSLDDEKLWVKDRIDLPPLPPMFADKGRPAALWLLLFARIEPLVIDLHPLAVGDAAHYYTNVIKSGGFPDSNTLTPDEARMRKDAGQYFANQVCRLDPDDPLDWGASMEVFVSDRFWFIKKIGNVEPTAFEISLQHGKPAVFKARTICNAMRESRVRRH